MKPIDYRDATFEDIRERLEGLREQVWKALAVHGPCTTRALAMRSGIDILTVRPRVTELVQLGLADCVGDKRGSQGVYAACTLYQAETHFLQRQINARNVQMELALA